MPVLDAFGSPLKIDQIWLPQLTLNNNSATSPASIAARPVIRRWTRRSPARRRSPATSTSTASSLALPIADQGRGGEARSRCRPKHRARDREAEEEGSDQAARNTNRTTRDSRSLYGFRSSPQSGLLNDERRDRQRRVARDARRGCRIDAADVIEFIGDAKIREQPATPSSYLHRPVTSWVSRCRSRSAAACRIPIARTRGSICSSAR